MNKKQLGYNIAGTIPQQQQPNKHTNITKDYTIYTVNRNKYYKKNNELYFDNKSNEDSEDQEDENEYNIINNERNKDKNKPHPINYNNHNNHNNQNIPEMSFEKNMKIHMEILNIREQQKLREQHLLEQEEQLLELSLEKQIQEYDKEMELEQILLSTEYQNPCSFNNQILNSNFNGKMVKQITNTDITILLLVNMDILEKYNNISDNRTKFLKYLIKQNNNIKLITKKPTKDILVLYPNTKHIINYIMSPGAGSIQEQLMIEDLKDISPQIKEITKHTTKENKIQKTLWFEDCQYINYIGSKIFLFNNLILSIKHQYIAYQYIKVNPQLKIYNMDHFIDDTIYKDYNLPKKYDIVFYGYINKAYPFRARLLQLLLKNRNLFKILYIKHPGYHNNENKKIVAGQELSKILNQSYLSICTKSEYDMLVKKYIETSLSNCLPCGDIPTDYNDIFSKYMIHINDTMTDNQIIQIIQNALHNKENLLLNTKKLRNIMLDKFVYSKGNEKFIRILKHITTTKTTSTKSV